MTINIQNSQFQQFVQFAEAQRSGRALAQVGANGPLGGRTIEVKQGHDFIGNIGRRSASKAINNQVRDVFRQSVSDLFGGEDRIPQSVRDAMRLKDYGAGKPLSARRILAVNRAISDAVTAAERESQAEITSEILSGKSTVMSEIISKSPMMKDGLAHYQNTINKATKTMVNSTIMSEMKKLENFSDKGSTFDIDIPRLLDVTLPGGVKLVNDAQTSRDQIAALITRGTKNLFKDLNDDERKRVNIVLSLLSQETTKCVEYGVTMRMDPQGQQTAISLIGPWNTSTSSTRFTLDLTDDGGISLVSVHDFTGNTLLSAVDGMKSPTETFAHDVRMVSEITIQISGQEMDNLAQKDWSVGYSQAMTDALAPGFQGDRLDALEAGIPNGFKIDMNVTGSIKLFT